jgi:hypothetical protein
MSTTNATEKLSNIVIDEIDVLPLREKIMSVYTINNTTKAITFVLSELFDNGLEFLNNTNILWSKKIIQLNEYLGNEMKNIRIAKKEKQAQNAASVNEAPILTISNIANQFPIFWKEKEKNSNHCGNFDVNDVKSFLSNLNAGTKNLPTIYSVQNISPIDSLIKFENEDIFDYCDRKSDTSPDKYDLSYGDLKLINVFITPILTYLFNNLINSDENLSEEFTRNTMYLVYKGGEKKNINNYRPLTILPILVRVFESVIVRKYHEIVLNSGSKNGMILRDVQKAILKDSSGVWEHNFEMNYLINKANEDKSNFAVFFIDLKNAYGSINYEQMFKIMKQYGFPDKFCKYLSKYYCNSTIEYNANVYKWKNGLFQGSSLSNILFLVFMDYIMRYLKIQLKNILDFDIIQVKRAFLYVDDIAFILPNEEKTNEILNCLEYGLFEHGMTINAKKTRVLYIDSSKKIPYKIGGEVISEVDEKFEYLGQPILYGQQYENIIKNRIRDILMGIDSFECSNNMKINVFLYKIYPRIKRMIENNLEFYGDKVFDAMIQYVKWYFLKWNVSQTDLNNFIKESKCAITQSIINKLVKSYNLYYLIGKIKLINNMTSYFGSEIGILTSKYLINITEGNKELEEVKKKYSNLMETNKLGKVYNKNFVEWVQ